MSPLNIGSMKAYQEADEKRYLEYSRRFLDNKSLNTNKKVDKTKVFCPHCKNEMLERMGMYGIFLYCTGKYCTYTKSVKKKNKVIVYHCNDDIHEWTGEW